MTEPAKNDPPTVSGSSPIRSGWRTSELYLKLAAVTLTALYASGVIPTDGPWAKVAAIAATALLSLGYTVSRTMIKQAGVLVLVLGLASSSSACGPSARQRAISTALIATNAAASSYLTLDMRTQRVIAESAVDRESAQVALAAWRTRGIEIQHVFAATYHAIATAATFKDARSVSSMIEAVLVLSTELKSLGVMP